MNKWVFGYINKRVFGDMNKWLYFYNGKHLGKVFSVIMIDQNDGDSPRLGWCNYPLLNLVEKVCYVIYSLDHTPPSSALSYLFAWKAWITSPILALHPSTPTVFPSQLQPSFPSPHYCFQDKQRCHGGRFNVSILLILLSAVFTRKTSSESTPVFSTESTPCLQSLHFILYEVFYGMYYIWTR